MSSKKITNKWISITIAFACYLLFGLIPAPAGLNQTSMQVIGIFIGTMILWNFVGTEWTSLLCMAILAIFQIMAPSEIFTSGFGNSTIAFLLAFFMLSRTLSQVGISRRIAIWCISNKLAQKGPWAFVIMFLFAAVLLASFMSQTAALLVFIPIAEQIFKELHIKKGSRFAQMIILGLGFAVGIGSANTPIGHAIILIPLQFLFRDTGINMNIITYSIFGVATGLVIFAVLILVYRFLYRPDLSVLETFDVSSLRKDMTVITKQEKISAIVFVSIIVIWLLQSVLQNILPAAGAYLNSLGTAVPTMVGIVILSVITVDGKPIMDYKDAAVNGVPWSGLIFNSAVLVLSGSLVLEKVGLSDFLIRTITPLVQGLPAAVFIIAIVALCILATNFSSNTVCATVFYTISIPIAMAMGNINVVALAALIGAAASYAFATPPSTLPMAVVAGSGWVDVKVMLKYGLLLAIVSIFALSCVGYPLANMLFTY